MEKISVLSPKKYSNQETKVNSNMGKSSFQPAACVLARLDEVQEELLY